MRSFSTLLFLLFTITIFASNYHGEIYQFKQPDGSTVDVRLFGSEFYMRAEGLDGYTLIRDKATKWICYANVSEDRLTLISTDIHYAGKKDQLSTLRDDLALDKHLDISPAAYQSMIDKNAQKLFGQPSYTAVQKGFEDPSRSGRALEGELKGLTIVIDFADEVHDLEIEDYENICNGLGYVKFGNNGSLREYFLDVSGGLLNYENEVFGIFRAPKTFHEYDSMPYAQGAREILGLALEWIEGQGFDFSTLSTDDNGVIMAINMMYTGNPPDWAQGMWFHQGYYGEFEADGVTTGRYNTSPANAPLTIGTIVHENGHMIGRWPDTYKYNNDNGPDGIGAFDVMCATGPSTNPVLPNPYFIDRVGWGHSLDVTDMNTRLKDTSNIYSSYIYRNKQNENEFFIFQSRLKTGRSSGIPDEGLTIWHIDRDGDNQTTHHETYLVHNNNDNTEHSGACFRKGRNEEFSFSSTPNSDFYDLNPSGLRLWDFSAKGDVMQYNIGRGPNLEIKYVNYENDNNGDGHLLANEDFDINVSLTNIDLGLSTSSTVKCIPYGPNAEFVTVHNPSIQPGEIEVDQSKLVTFHISLDAGTPVYAPLSFRFEVEEDNRTDFTEKHLFTGYVYNMDTVEITTCDAMFLDPGGLEKYGNNIDYVQTFYPSTPGEKVTVKFLEFDVEGGAGCNNDYLRVYDGTDISGVAKKYCGELGPPDFTSTDTSGALTFVFHSGINNAFPGWKARVTCTAVSKTKLTNTELITNIYPNPAHNKVNMNFSKVADYNILIIDMLGNVILQNKLKNNDVLSLPVDYLVKGVYNVQISSGNAFTTKKLVIQ